MDTSESTLKRAANDQSEIPVVSAAAHANELKAEAQTLSPKERLSAYFTIAAAAFGLISDGCEY